MLRPASLEGGPGLAAALTKLDAAVGGGAAFMGGGRGPALADVVVACTLLGVDDVRGKVCVCVLPPLFFF